MTDLAPPDNTSANWYIAAYMGQEIEKYVSTSGMIFTWLTGVAGGGVGDDGKYPITLANGTIVQVPSPAQMEADFAGGNLTDDQVRALFARFQSLGLFTNFLSR